MKTQITNTRAADQSTDTDVVSAEQKPGFWKRVANVIDQMEKTEMDFVWDRINQLLERTNKLEQQVAELEQGSSIEGGS